MERTGKKYSVQQLAILGMFCALAYAIMLLSKLIPNVEGFLSLDFKDVIIAIASLLFGPIQGVIISIVVSFFEMITVSTTGPIGFLMNILSTCAFVVPMSVIYKRKKRFSAAIIGAVTGIVCMTLTMLLWNWLITPLYMGVTREVVTGLLFKVFLPFNLIKGALNAAATLLLYKPIVSALRRASLLPPSTGAAPKRKLSIGVTLVSLFVLASLVLVVLVWTGTI